MATVTKDLCHHFAIQGGVARDLCHHFQLGYATADLCHHFSIVNAVSKDLGHHFRVLADPGTGSGNVRSIGATVTIYSGASSKILPVDSITITRRKVGSSPSLEWSVTIFDPEGDYNPDNASSEWHEWLTPDLQPVGTPNKTVSITIETDYPGDGMTGTRTYTDLIILQRSYNADPSGGYTMTISGTDYSQVLFRDNQTMETWERAQAHDIITDILTEFGFTESNVNLDFPDFPVVQMDFQRDRPINRIQKLLNVAGAFWRVEGRRFIAWVPVVRSGADWTYKDSERIYTLSMDEQVINLYNKITVSRVQKTGYVAYTQEGTSDGRQQNGKFSGKFANPHLQVIENFGCEIENVDYFLNGSHVGTTFHLSGYADEVYFTVTPTDPDIATQWKIEVTGVPAAYVGSGIDLDATYTYEDAGSIATYGELIAPPIEDSFVPSDDFCQSMAEAFMRENGRLKRTISFAAPVNPWLELDETIKVEEGVSTYSGYFNVESVTTTIQGPAGEDTLEVVEYVD